MNHMPAVDIDEVKRITRGNYRSGLRLDRLPKLPLDISSVKREEVAVLSWRWDIDAPTFTSINVAVSIEHAARTGMKYVFFDLVSIDQTLEGEALIQSVANLAALYSSIPVIAAYDEKDTPAWLKTMRRPWISFEVGAYKSNPTRVTYVGHVEGQGTAEKFGFEHMLDRVWRSSYTNSILMVLSNQVSMGNTRDFRYMIPDYASTLTLCHFSMRRADYLLSAAILAQTNETDIRLNGDLEFIDQHFDLYSFSNASYAGYHDSRDIILSGQKIAIWYRGIDGRSNERRKLSAELGAEETILSSIGEAKSPRTQAAPRKSTTSASPQIEIKRADFG